MEPAGAIRRVFSWLDAGSKYSAFLINMSDFNLG
jgi:hypothetical protein